MINEKKRKQIIFDVSPEIHQKVKVLSAMRNISMNLFLQRAIVREINRQERNEDKDES